MNDDSVRVTAQRHPPALEVDDPAWSGCTLATDFHVRPYDMNDPLFTAEIKHVAVTVDLPKSADWARFFADATLDARRRLAADQRRYMSGPDRFERKLARLYGIEPHLLGLTPPPLAIDGAAYRRRQRNRVKRGR